MIKGTFHLIQNTLQAAGMGVVLEHGTKLLKNEAITNYLSRAVAVLPQIPKAEVIASYLPIATSAVATSAGLACFGVVRIADTIGNLVEFGQFTSKEYKAFNGNFKRWFAQHFAKQAISITITVLAGAVAGGVIGFGAGAMGSTALSVATLAATVWGITKVTDFAFFSASTVLLGLGSALYCCGTCLTGAGNLSSDTGHHSNTIDI